MKRSLHSLNKVISCKCVCNLVAFNRSYPVPRQTSTSSQQQLPNTCARSPTRESLNELRKRPISAGNRFLSHQNQLCHSLFPTTLDSITDALIAKIVLSPLPPMIGDPVNRSMSSELSVSNVSRITANLGFTLPGAPHTHVHSASDICGRCGIKLGPRCGSIRNRSAPTTPIEPTAPDMCQNSQAPHLPYKFIQPPCCVIDRSLQKRPEMLVVSKWLSRGPGRHSNTRK